MSEAFAAARMRNQTITMRDDSPSVQENSEQPDRASAVQPKGGTLSRTRRPQWIRVISFGALLILIFWKPLTSLATMAASSDIHSHILLVPFITAYLIYIQRHRLPWSC